VLGQGNTLGLLAGTLELDGSAIPDERFRKGLFAGSKHVVPVVARYVGRRDQKGENRASENWTYLRCVCCVAYVKFY
jgi:hypothetical protein